MSSVEKMAARKKKVILDVDTGVDDAHAIILALTHPSVDVVAITCANGNLKIDDVVANTFRVLQTCKRFDVPVFKGAARTLLGKVSPSDNYSAEVWKTPVDLSKLQSEHAAIALVRFANQFPGEITLVALAPLTNVAMALNLDPNFSEKLHDIIIMGGNIGARGREFVEEWTGADNEISRFLQDSMETPIQTAKSESTIGFKSCDGYALAVFLDDSVVKESQKIYGTVELNGYFTRGQMVVDWYNAMKEKENICVILELNLKMIEELFRSMITRNKF
ncbi:probable uridine nucleosidase 2 isoform X3 [Pomacea canaliculata]|uniref:probable uridine nucleosidase 2 isoform X3 n=1 Tax=Pomacea canaliculata TaxID=400727 RepID=UPI000D73F7AB|nr:probable uridine nucleosidase 2 isoform X3 [Pomacea canaliculata]